MKDKEQDYLDDSYDRKKDDEATEARIDMSDYISYYQAGFLDGFNWSKGKEYRFEQIKDKCKKSFELRFMKKITKEIQKKQK